MNGVIVDDEHLHEEATRYVLKKYGHACTTAEYKQYFAGRTRDAGFKNYGVVNKTTYDIHQLSEEKDRAYQQLAKEGLRTVDHVVDFIVHLNAIGRQMAVVTGAPRKEAKHVLEEFGLADYFSQIITGEDITLSKPHPEGYLKAAAMLQVPPSACVVVEDAPNGIKAAKRAGMSCIAITTSHAGHELSDADWVIERLSCDILAQINPGARSQTA
jgi:HAD superfamily hydrolase (TIGR01509 family)